MFQSAADRLSLPRRNPGTVKTEPARDIHDIDHILGDEDALSALLTATPQSFAATPVDRRKIQGMGVVYDYRAFTQPNGGKIRPLVFVQHIPVVRQMAGRLDFDVLLRVLQAQGLMVQRATDWEGNVAKYTPLDRLCWQARGANAISAGVEHMHLTTAESWTERQLNAAAYCAWEMREKTGVPLERGRLGDGNGLVSVRRRGQTTHEAVSRHAGFNDRSDPGVLYEARMADVRERALFYDQHRRF